MLRNIFLTIISFIVLQTVSLADTVKFIQVTDSHFVAGESYIENVLESTVKTINKEKGISFVVFTGDNIDKANEADLIAFINIVNKLHVPYYVVLGDHDVYKSNGLSKDRYMEVLRENNIRFFKYRKPNYMLKKGEYVFLFVDGAKEVVPGSLGYYKADTLSWLNKKLNSNKKKSVVIFQHFPLYYSKELKSHRVYNKEEYIKLLGEHDNVIAIVSGHMHNNSEVMKDGIYHIVTPSLLSNPHSYKIITVSSLKGFSPMIYTELKEVDMTQK